MANSKKDYVSKYKGEEIDELLEGVETLQGEGEGSVNKIVNDTVAEKIAEVVNDAPEDFDTLKEMSDWIANHENSASTMNSNIAQLRTETDTLNNTIVKKQDKIQYTILPAASADILGKIVQYIGETSPDNINGRFYKCVVGETKTAFVAHINESGHYVLYYGDGLTSSGKLYYDRGLSQYYSTFTMSFNSNPYGVNAGNGKSGYTEYNWREQYNIYTYKWQETSLSESEIDDTQSSESSTYSSNKINDLITTDAQNITNLQSETQRIENKFDNKYISKIVTSLPIHDIEVGVIYMMLKEGIDPSDVQSPLIPQMSSNTSDICDVSVDSIDSIYSGDAWNVFDRDSTTGWMGQGQAGKWVKIDFHGSPQVVTKIELTPDYVNDVVRIRDFTLAGSNDNFVTSKTIYSGTHGNNTNMETFTFDNTEAFSYYKLTLTSYWEFGGLGIKEMQLYGAGSDDLGDNLFDKWINFNGSSTGWERFNENGTASGHIITNSLNEEQTEREKLKFSDDFNITDNETNDSTEISERLLTNQEIDDILDSIPTVNENGETVINNIIIDVPVGTILPLMQETAPNTYLICDGTEYLKADYPELSDVLLNLTEHTQYEGSDEDHFKVPDLRGEFLRGAGTNSHENQGSGSDVGTHQDGTLHKKLWIWNNGLYYGHSNEGDADSYETTNCYYGGVGSSIQGPDAQGRRYTSRPTNTSVLYCIKAVSKETHNQAIVSSTIVNEQDNEYNGIPFRFAIDENGNYGYIKDGADTVTPFKSSGSNTAQGLVHLTTTDFIGETVTGTDGENTVTGTFDENGECNILVSTNGPWTFSYNGYNITVDSLSLFKDISLNSNIVIFTNGAFNKSYTSGYTISGNNFTLNGYGPGRLNRIRNVDKINFDSFNTLRLGVVGHDGYGSSSVFIVNEQQLNNNWSAGYQVTWFNNCLFRQDFTMSAGTYNYDISNIDIEGYLVFISGNSSFGPYVTLSHVELL